MLDGAKIAVIVPAFREERQLGRMLGRIPAFVDAVYVVDDASDDGTLAVARSAGDPRVRCLVHGENRGVGAAIVSGYRAALDEGHDVLAVMAADDQMHPDDLAPVVRGVLSGVDYAKGNRFVHPDARSMPPLRRAGGELFSLLTRVSTGLRISDSQCGYTALAARAASLLPLGELFPRYGYPNDLLGMLAARGFTVVDVPVRPVYADERSGLRPWHVARIPFVIARRWWKERRRALSS
ncbi:MAG TPA: glycosyltransferase family 2 protein [Polyangiaceae bacterium]|nr:glycosyltransferase family 2 protein [Polyangiaceae bacterium]